MFSLICFFSVCKEKCLTSQTTKGKGDMDLNVPGKLTTSFIVGSFLIKF